MRRQPDDWRPGDLHRSVAGWWWAPATCAAFLTFMAGVLGVQGRLSMVVLPSWITAIFVNLGSTWFMRRLRPLMLHNADLLDRTPEEKEAARLASERAIEAARKEDERIRRLAAATELARVLREGPPPET